MADCACTAHAQNKKTNMASFVPDIVGEDNLADFSAEFTDIEAIEAELMMSEDTFCVCRGALTDSMLACDNNSCEIGWFHLSCVGQKSIPVGIWTCPQCSGKFTVVYFGYS